MGGMCVVLKLQPTGYMYALPAIFSRLMCREGGLLEVLYGNIMLVIFDHTFYITSTYIPQSLVIQHSHLLIHQQL